MLTRFFADQLVTMHHAKRESTTVRDNAPIGRIIYSTHQLLNASTIINASTITRINY